MQLIPVYKPAGIESSTIVRDYKQKYPNQLVMHTGALDPLAEGLLLIAVGFETQQEVSSMIHKEKKYTFEILLGLRTDSWDVLGIPESIMLHTHETERLIEKAVTFISNYTGFITQRVPVFSNLRYKDKRLHTWAREGKAHLVPPIYRERFVNNITNVESNAMPSSEVYRYILHKVQQIQGDFRQEQILDAWDVFFSYLTKDLTFPLVSAEITCASGTYIRSIAHALGEHLGCGAVCWHIRRTQIGTITLEDVKK